MPRNVPKDVDKFQSIKDLLFEKNEYHLDLRFVLRGRSSAKPEGKHPLAILVPGGGYEMVCSFIEGVPIARRLNALGISAPIVYYRVKKKAHLPAPQDDLARGVKELLARADELNLETENYSVWGASAGGHLTASFGTKTLGYETYGLPRPGALVLSYPVVTMKRELTHQGSHDALLGADATPEAEEAASIENLITPDYPPTYLWTGLSDRTVPPENSRMLDRALKDANVRHTFETFEELDHGLGPATGTAAAGWIDRAVQFWLGRETVS